MDHIIKKLNEARGISTKVRCTSCKMKREWLIQQLGNELDDCIGILERIQNRNEARQKQEFNVDELSKYDGNEGRQAYIAVNGVVYDVSNEPTWAGASHFGLFAGKELTVQFSRCHSSEEALAKLPIVGRLKK